MLLSCLDGEICASQGRDEIILDQNFSVQYTLEYLLNLLTPKFRILQKTPECKNPQNYQTNSFYIFHWIVKNLPAEAQYIVKTSLTAGLLQSFFSHDCATCIKGWQLCVLSLLFGHLTSKTIQLLLSVLLELQECPHTLLESASLASNSKEK